MSHRALGPQFFHGTVENLNPGDVVTPAGTRGGHTNYAGQSDPQYAYATEDPEAAWDYAEKAWHAASGDSGHPRVYVVSPMGRHDKDPEYDKSGRHRGNWSFDRRSKHGWKVEDELPMPESMGKPEDWR